MRGATPFHVGLLTLVVCSAAFAQKDQPTGDRDKQNKAAYERGRAKAGRSADAHVEVARWCEANGMEPERLKHLTIATLLDPDHAAARGLKGLVEDEGRWRRPEDVEVRIKSDDALLKILAEYDRLRVAPSQTADDHWKLALWCEEHDLKSQSRAHLRAVVRLDPKRALAWRRLGYELHDGRWMTPNQIASERTATNDQRKANIHWVSVLRSRRAELRTQEGRIKAEKSLGEVSDQLAVPAIWRVFALGNAPDHCWAVRLLGQTDSSAGTRALAVLALFSPSADARRAATETLANRDPYSAVGPIISMLGDAAAFEPDPNVFKYRWRLIPIGSAGIGSLGAVLVESAWFDSLTLYSVPETRRPAAFDGLFAPRGGYEDRIKTQRERQLTELNTALDQIGGRTQRYLQTLETAGLPVRAFNSHAIQILRVLTKQDFGDDREAWRKWWIEEQGYAYVPPSQPSTLASALALGPKPFFVDSVYLSSSCFAAGTPVRTRAGLQPIEKLRIGDEVLTQEATTGVLSYQTIEDVAHNPPAQTLRLKTDSEVIQPTAIHRFWKVGRGWVMAQDLVKGDAVRSVSGTARILAVERGPTQLVYNLLVPDTHSFFVGDRGLLVHDNSRLTPKPVEPDLQASLATAGP